MQQSLEDLLIQTKLISSPQLAVAQRDAEIRKKPLAQTLIDLGFVSDKRFAEWIAGITKIPVVDPLPQHIVTEFENHVPAQLARDHLIVAIDVDADEMTIATVDPLNKSSIEAVQSATGMKIHPVIAVLGQLRQMVDQFYPPAPTFDPSATIAAPLPDQAPFEYGDETMLRMHSRQFTFERSVEDSLGSDTRIVPPKAEEPPKAATNKSESQLDRIERQLSELVRGVDALQRRVDAIDATLARIVNRSK